MIKKEDIKKKVVEGLSGMDNLSKEKVLFCIDQVLSYERGVEYLSYEERVALKKELYHSIFGLDILEELLEDDNVTEIMINGPENIFVERCGEIKKWDRTFADKRKLTDIIQRIVSGINRRVNEKNPIVDARLKDGSRVNVVLDPVAVNGPVVTIRKFSKSIIDMEDMIRLKTVNEEVSLFLKKLVRSGYNIFISGGTGSGKTTFLNVLSGLINSDERVITIEDSVELQIKNISNLVTMEVRNKTDSGEGEIKIRDLIKTSLRMRPDRIIVGEVRGAECVDMLQAMNTGHDGSMSTGHANSPEDMMIRLETMVLMGMDIPIAAARNQIAAGLDIIIHLGRLKDKSRKVLSICEIEGVDKESIKLKTIYRFKEKGEDNEGKIMGDFIKCGELSHKGKLERYGYGD